MPLYVLNRNYVLRSTNGVLSFTEGEPSFVPPYMEREVIAIGGVRAEGETPSPLPNEKPVYQEPQGLERQEEIRAAFDLIIDKNDSKEFTAQGVPSVKAMEKIVAFTMDKAEIVEEWNEYKIFKAEAAQ